MYKFFNISVNFQDKKIVDYIFDIRCLSWKTAQILLRKKCRFDQRRCKDRVGHPDDVHKFCFLKSLKKSLKQIIQMFKVWTLMGVFGVKQIWLIEKDKKFDFRSLKFEVWISLCLTLYKTVNMIFTRSQNNKNNQGLTWG